MLESWGFISRSLHFGAKGSIGLLASVFSGFLCVESDIWDITSLLPKVPHPSHLERHIYQEIELFGNIGNLPSWSFPSLSHRQPSRTK